MRYILPAAVVLLLISACTGPQQSMTMENYKTNDVEKQYKTLLIVGEGNMQAKMYLYDLTSNLTKALAKKNIDCHYEYLGDDAKTDVFLAYSKINTGQYDAVLQILPIELQEKTYNKAQKVLASATGAVLVGVPTARLFQMRAMKLQANRMVNDFTFTITEKKDTAVIWQSRLRAFMKPTSTYFYKELRTKIMDTLEENKIVSAN